MRRLIDSASIVIQFRQRQASTDSCGQSFNSEETDKPFTVSSNTFQLHTVIEIQIQSHLR